MPDLFAAAALYMPKIRDQANPRRAKLIQELENLLKSSPFITENEKEKMRKVIPIFSDSIIANLKETLIRENLRYLQEKMEKPNN